MTNVDVVKAMYAAFGRKDIGAIVERLTPDCQWNIPGSGIPNAGRYHGPAGVAEFFKRMAESEEITRFEPREFFSNESGDVVSHGFREARIIANGRMAQTNWMFLYRFRDGKVAYFESFYDTSAFAAAHAG